MKNLGWWIFLGMAGGCMGLIYLGSVLAKPSQAAGSFINFENQDKDKKGFLIENQAAVIKNAVPCIIHPTFPEPVKDWCHLIQATASENHLDPNLIAAIMVVESGGDQYALSSSGAVGLLQIMPKDGTAASFQCVSGPCFYDRPTSQELYDAAFNISYGTRLIAGLIQRYGDLREALRAYGPLDVGYDYADKVLSIFQDQEPSF